MGERWGEKGQREKTPDPNGRLLKVFVHPAHDVMGGVGGPCWRGWTSPCGHGRGKLFVDWEYRGLEETASSLGLELEKDPCPAGAEPASCQGL
jgi:hypothetical protein